MAKSTLTQAKIAQLARYIRVGAPMAVAFAASRVAKTTYYRWMNIGQALYEDDLDHPDIPKRPTRKASESDHKYNRRLRRHDEKLERFVTLYETLQKAAFLCHNDMLMVIRSAAFEKGDWRAAIWILDRRFAKDWNPKWIQRLAAEQNHQQQEHSIMDPDFLEFCRAAGRLDRAIARAPWNGPDSLPKAG